MNKRDKLEEAMILALTGKLQERANPENKEINHKIRSNSETWNETSRENLKAMGYELTNDGWVKNPKTGKSFKTTHSIYDTFDTDTVYTRDSDEDKPTMRINDIEDYHGPTYDQDRKAFDYKNYLDKPVNRGKYVKDDLGKNVQDYKTMKDQKDTYQKEADTYNAKGKEYQDMADDLETKRKEIIKRVKERRKAKEESKALDSNTHDENGRPNSKANSKEIMNWINKEANKNDIKTKNKAELARFKK